jgi:hypothetical protein
MFAACKQWCDCILMHARAEVPYAVIFCFPTSAFLAMLLQALTPVVEGIIGQDMLRFKEYATAYAKAQASSQQQQQQVPKL